MKFKDNLDCVYCELNYWDYDEDGQKFPISYELTFKFYGTDVIAYVTTEELQNEEPYVEFAAIEADGESLESFEQVFESFEQVFENNEFKDKVCKVCEDCWNDWLDSDNYNYKGEPSTSTIKSISQ